MDRRFTISFALVLGVLALAALCVVDSAVAAEKPWWPIQVKSYYGTYDASMKKPGQAAPGLDRPKLEEWRPPVADGKTYRLGVSFPHMKDPYWVAVNYGIVDEAKRLGMGITLVEAGGYDNLQTQLDQLRTLAEAKVDGIILGAVSYTGNDGIIRELARQGIPVVEVINDVLAPNVAAKALVSYHEMGYMAGEFVAEHAEKTGSEEMSVLFFPGPEQSGWAPETLDGFKAAIAHFPGRFSIVDVQWGDTGHATQREALRRSLEKGRRVDYIVGNAVAAEVATELLDELGLADRVKVVSTYITPALHPLIGAGKVLASPSDLTVFQGRMAVDMLVRFLNGQTPGRDFPFRSGPFIPMVTTDNIDIYPFEGLFGPPGYVPVFNLEQRR